MIVIAKWTNVAEQIVSIKSFVFVLYFVTANKSFRVWMCRKLGINSVLRTQMLKGFVLMWPVCVKELDTQLNCCLLAVLKWFSSYSRFSGGDVGAHKGRIVPEPRPPRWISIAPLSGCYATVTRQLSAFRHQTAADQKQTRHSLGSPVVVETGPSRWCG